MNFVMAFYSFVLMGIFFLKKLLLRLLNVKFGY